MKGAYALGATRWEAIRMALFYARTGIVGSIMLGFGRALGETMAVTMVIGNTPQVSTSLYAPQYTMAAVIANEFAEAADELHLNALVEIGLVLFIITLGGQRGVARVHLVARPAEPAAAGARGRAGGGGRPDAERCWRKFMSHLVVALCGARGAALARAAGVHPLLRPQAGSLRRSTGRFFTQMPVPPGETGGGMANGIVGSLIVTGLGALFAIPIGVTAGVYAAEYRGTRLANAIRFAADTLNGVPSIVIGVFAYGVAVLPFHHFSAAGRRLRARHHDAAAGDADDRGAAAAGAARRCAKGALALGATRARAVFTVVLPAALPGILTGILLALARVAGETAPLLFTALNNAYFSTDPRQPISTLTVQVYTYATSPYPDWHQQAWAGALVLVTMVLTCSVLARVATTRMERMQRGS